MRYLLGIDDAGNASRLSGFLKFAKHVYALIFVIAASAVFVNLESLIPDAFNKTRNNLFPQTDVFLPVVLSHTAPYSNGLPPIHVMAADAAIWKD